MTGQPLDPRTPTASEPGRPADAPAPPDGRPAPGAPGRRRRRRGDASAVVPDVEFQSYYGRNIIQPPPWTHDIAAYLFLGGLAAGSGLIAAGAAFTGRPRLRRRGRVAALAALLAGGGALAHDLGRPERVLNMMRTAKLTSPMSVGSWILLGFGACSGAALATEVATAALPADGRLARAARLADPVAAAGAAFFGPPLAAYTAVLLSDTAAPTWHAGYRELPALFVSSATAAGAGLALVTSPPAETGPVRVLAAVAAASDLVAGRLLTRRLGDLAEPLQAGRAGRLHRLATALTAAGGLGAALAGRSRVVAAASGLALVAGSAATRFSIFDAGIASAKDPKYTVVPQRARADAAASRGEGITQPGGPWPT